MLMEAACIFGSDLENVLLPSGAPPKAEAWGRRSLCTKVPKTSGRVGFIPGLGFLTASLPELANEQQNFRGYTLSSHVGASIWSLGPSFASAVGQASGSGCLGISFLGNHILTSSLLCPRRSKSRRRRVFLRKCPLCAWFFQSADAG